MSQTDFLFQQDTALTWAQDPEPEVGHQPPWWVLIVDDDESIHQITTLVLRGFSFEGRPIQLLHAYSAREARKILEQQHHIAVAIVDVVMETNHAGLDLIKTIRGELQQHQIRLILRTGQPGEAPEESVIRDYDINDYKNKTEVTAIKLKTLLYSSLRSYRDICIIDNNKKGLEKIIASTVSFLECESLTEFASNILAQVAHLLGLDHQQIFCCAATGDPKQQHLSLDIIAASGLEIDAHPQLPADVIEKLTRVHHLKQSYHGDDYFVGYFTTSRGLENLLYVSKDSKFDQVDHHLLSYFSSNIAVAYENIRLRELIKESQRELSYILGEAVEKRSKETGSHVKRVANFSFLLAQKYGLSFYEAEKIKLASPLHDVGKIAIPDYILNKPGKHDAAEWDIMRQHAEIGYQILQKSQNEILQQGAIIAYEHHERWDGQGYPRGLRGEQIHISGRITALADVFDALASERCYKEAWPMPKVLQYLADEKGKQFDPVLVDILLGNLDEFIAIRDAYPDHQAN
jgi:response regulator RpfG family c-di-GMP phosphodiesterase